jgi:hypothetical protein
MLSGPSPLRYAASVLRPVCLTLMALVMACGGAPKSPMVAAAPHDARPGPRRIPILYSLRGRNFPLPIAKVTVGGIPTLALVDTGANSHIITGWLARKAKLLTASMGDVGVDHVGHSLDTRRAPHPNIVIEGWGELTDAETLVTDVPDAITNLGIGMFLSAQQLATSDTPVILDLQERELRESTGDADIADTVRGLAKLTTKPAKACIDDDSAVPSRAFVVSGRIDGNPADLLLDTGATRTDLLGITGAGKALLPKTRPNNEPVVAASGMVTSGTVRSALVDVGDVHRTVDVDVLEGKLDPFCPRDGVLAMDVLASCALVFEPKNVQVYCKDTPSETKPK